MRFTLEDLKWPRFTIIDRKAGMGINQTEEKTGYPEWLELLRLMEPEASLVECQIYTDI